MKVLFLLPESPYPPDRGPRTHTLGLLQAASRSHECHVMGFFRGHEGLARWSQLKKAIPQLSILAVFPELDGWKEWLQAIICLCRLHPISVRSYVSSHLATQLEHVVSQGNYDLIHVDQFKLAHYWKYVVDLPSILVPYDAFSLKSLRVIKSSVSLYEKMKAFYYFVSFMNIERRAYIHYSLVAPVSQVDTLWLKSKHPNLNLSTIEVPVADVFLSNATPVGCPDNKPHVICVGTLSSDSVAQGTVDFLANAVPQIQKVVPDVQITIWGQKPISSLVSLIQQTPNAKHVGWVDDYIGLMRKAWVYVYPQASGTGIQTKLQQAMALGLPVVARRETLEPLYVQSGTQAFVCHNANEMAEAVVELVQNKELRLRVGEAAHKHIRKHFSKEVIGLKLNKAYQEITNFG